MMKREDGAFEDRKKSHEAKYKMDEERRFKIRARRNKLLGFRVAQSLGLDESAAGQFAQDAVMAGLETPDDADLVSHLKQVAADRGTKLDETEMLAWLTELQETANRQIMEEFPAALGTDHGPVGDSPYSKE